MDIRNQGFTEAIRKSPKEVRSLVVGCPGLGAYAGLKAIRTALREGRFTAVVAITNMVALGVYCEQSSLLELSMKSGSTATKLSLFLEDVEKSSVHDLHMGPGGLKRS